MAAFEESRLKKQTGGGGGGRMGRETNITSEDYIMVKEADQRKAYINISHA